MIPRNFEIQSRVEAYRVSTEAVEQLSGLGRSFLGPENKPQPPSFMTLLYYCHKASSRRGCTAIGEQSP